MPAIGYEAVEPTGGQPMYVRRPWFSWVDSAWTINVELWASGMVCGVRPPWTPSPLVHLLRDAAPACPASAPMPVAEAVREAARTIGLGQPRGLPRGRRGEGQARFIVAGLPGTDVALVASDRRLIVIGRRDVHLWFFRLLADRFPSARLNKRPGLSTEALDLLASEGPRYIPNLHALRSELQRTTR